MGELRGFLGSRSVAEIAFGFAMGYVLVELLHAFSAFILNAAWPFPRSAEPFFGGVLYASPDAYVVHIGPHFFIYGDTLAWLLTATLGLLLAWLVLRRLARRWTDETL